jgi:hypothetical protein
VQVAKEFLPGADPVAFEALGLRTAMRVCGTGETSVLPYDRLRQNARFNRWVGGWAPAYLMW